MKRFLTVLLSCLIAFSVCGCEPKATDKPDETVTPEKTVEPKIEVDFSFLEDYTIVYPASYSEWKMEEVEVLKYALSKLTKTEISAIPDTVEAAGKEIILASSSRATAFDSEIEGFANAMCYAIGTDGDNIVLGGQNFYSDMRAIYDFLNNYIGYDDFTDTFGDPTAELKDEKVVLWEQPKFHIMGSNFAVDAYTESWQIKDFADCNFNLLQIIYDNYSEEHTERDVAKWCARYGIEMMLLPGIDWTATQVYIRNEEDLIENPAMWGLYICDEPADLNVCSAMTGIIDKAKNKYSQYGWKCYVNIAGFGPDPEDEAVEGECETVQNWRTYFANSDALSFDWYINKFDKPYDYVAYSWETWRDLAEELNQELYIYIDAWNLQNRGGNTKKMFRSHMYLALMFDADMVEYFQYGDASRNYDREGNWTKGSLINYDYTKNDYYYDAQKANEEIMKITDILDDYDYLGTFSENPEEYQFVELKNQYDGFSDIVSIDDNEEVMLLCACYEENDGNKKALLMANMKTLSDYDLTESWEEISVGSTPFIKKTGYDGRISYDEYEEDHFKLRINADKVTCYLRGEPIELTKNSDGTFDMISFDGDCYLFIIE